MTKNVKKNLSFSRHRTMILLLLLLLFCAVGCRDSPAGTGVENGRMTESSSDNCAATAEVPPTDQFIAKPAGWLTVSSLTPILKQVEPVADRLGCAAARVCPDPSSGQSFLCAAATAAEAGMLNGFFYWFLDNGAARPNEKPPLLLVVDRMFSEQSRQTAMAGGMYSDPRAERLLNATLRLILSSADCQPVQDFILTCYRQDFESRLKSGELSPQTWTRVFANLEVTYEQALTSTVSFRILPSASASDMDFKPVPAFVGLPDYTIDNYSHIRADDISFILSGD